MISALLNLQHIDKVVSVIYNEIEIPFGIYDSSVEVLFILIFFKSPVWG